MDTLNNGHLLMHAVLDHLRNGRFTEMINLCDAMD